MEEEKIVTSKLQFLYECKKRIEKLHIPSFDDEKVMAIPEIFEEEKMKVIKELEAEAICWDVETTNGITEKNFTSVKGKIMGKIIEQVAQLKEEEGLTSGEPPRL